MNLINRILSAFVLTMLSVVVVSGQDTADSVILANAGWKQFACKEPGLTVRMLDTDVFGGHQRFFCVEIDPAVYEIAINQFEYLTKVKTAVHEMQSDAVAAINGGFFVTKIEKAIPVHFIKTAGTVHKSEYGRGGDAVAVCQNGRLQFARWSAADTVWPTEFTDIMVAGPMLLLDGKNLFPEKNNAGGRHPRSCIGSKADGTVIMLVADGRRKNANGLSFPELAFLCKALGMQSALNLDGGGSTTLWTKCKNTVNRPSDGLGPIHRDRKVCNMISVFPK